MTKSRKSVGLVLGIAALAGALAPAAPPPADANKALAQEQLKLARQALHDLDLMNEREGLGRTDPRFALWERRQVEAIRAAGAGKAELIAALEDYLKRMREQERLAQLSIEKAQGTRIDLWDAQYRTLEAEMWLNHEKAR